MAWLIGIDEAGYGPNLGPMVQSAVAIHALSPAVNFWDTLRKVARRATDESQGRLAIDDSKAIYPGPGGLARLEEALLTAFPAMRNRSLHDLMMTSCVNGSAHDLAGEPWYTPHISLPIEVDLNESEPTCDRWAKAVDAEGITFAAPLCAVTPTPRFNAVLDEHGSKGAVTGRGIISLIAACYDRADGEALFFTLDKLGGRNFYAAMIQTALPDGWVTAIRESAELSEYEVVGLKVPVHVTVRPRAESDQMAVALASMLSKYLREVLMRQFNHYWLTHVPGLAPTAGYPVDATRFFAAIRPTCARLGFAEETIWRRK